MIKLPKALLDFKKNKVLKNAFYLGLIQIVNYVFPLLTVPFLIKILGVERFGTIAFSQVVISYICIVCDYGFNMSATRDISLKKHNHPDVNKIFSAVMCAKIIIAFILVPITFVAIFYMPVFNAFRTVYLISLLFVVGQILFPTWLFQGMEQMGRIALFNSVFKFIFTVSVFLFVHSKDDIELVAWIYVFGSLTSGLSAFVYAIKTYKLRFVKITYKDLKGLFEDGFDVFLPSFFSSVLSSGGILILGILHTPLLVGYYSAIDRLVKAGIGLLSSITQSMFPDIAYKFSTNKDLAINSIKKIGTIVLSALSFVFFAMLFLSGYLLKTIYNVEYLKYAYILNVLLFWVIISFLNNFIGIQFLVGSGKSKFYRKAFLISGFVMILSFITIKFWDINGVLFSTLFGECILTVTMLYFIKKNKLYGD